MDFPKLPQRILDSLSPVFMPAPTLKEWAYHQFINEGGPLQNPDHDHLKDAEILFMWSSITFKRSGKVVVGTAQRGLQQGSLGKKELIEAQYREWYGGALPDFVITICGPYVREADPVSLCALIEHELYHCAQQQDEFGQPMFTETNWPKWTLRGHDIEEFVGIAARYGAFSPELQALRTVLNRKPLVSVKETAYACGCGSKV